MKRYIHASDWPEDLTYDEYEEGDQLIEGLIAAIETLGLFEEPSAQGGVGSDFFYLEDDPSEPIAEIDLQEETRILLNLYNKSSSRADFQKKVEKWLEDFCNL